MTEGRPEAGERAPGSASAAPGNRRQRRRRVGCLVLLALAVLAGFGLHEEATTSRVQSAVLTRVDRQLTYRMAPGPSDSIWFPEAGPFDTRRAYTLIPAVARVLLDGGYRIEAQARLSPRMHQLTEWGLYPVYRERTRAGLDLLDREGATLYRTAFPQRVYTGFDSIPGPVVNTLLFIENRELLDPEHPTQNPAVEWDRLAKAMLDLALGKVAGGRAQPGGSTIPTQLEKFRHSPEGRTGSVEDKLRQMIAASLRMYMDGPDTREARRRAVTEYLNSVPLAAAPGFGEVNGLADGLWAWYDADFDRVNRLLRDPDRADADPDRARAYKQVLSLFIAHRRPSAYLVTNRAALRPETDAYLRILARAGVISPGLRDAALPLPLEFRTTPPVLRRPSYIDRKAANAIRTRLLTLLGLPQLYVLDRADLRAETTLDGPTERAMSRRLERLNTPGYADSLGLRGYRLLERGDPSRVIYSFTLYEATPRGNLLCVQADNYDQPLDINTGARLDLGSTAKLRTLVTYLDAVASVHAAQAGRRAKDLRAERDRAPDPIRRWALDWLASAPDTSLAPMLDAALERSYPADPREKFFTGGGLHTFRNFNRADDDKVLTVREGLRNSVNLVFIRLMRDLVRYHQAEIPGFRPEILENRDDPARRAFLARFADEEGKSFLLRFYRKYREKTSEESAAMLEAEVRPTARKLAALFRALHPEAGPDSMAAYLRVRLPGARITAKDAEGLYAGYAPGAYDLQDLGYILGLHPLELWMARYHREHPGADWPTVVAASAGARQESYKWLFTTQSLEKQNKRIRILLEEDAFRRIHAQWVRLGYPFETLTPSYATAIGSSGDRPAALATLMGILVQDGVKFPQRRLERLHFAEGTPFETVFASEAPAGVRVLRAEVARAARGALLDVVQNGTARRAYGAFRDPEGGVIPLGGKTGTGDHRYQTYGPGGRLLESRVVNRTATFVFFIGDRFYGTVVAFVPGEAAAGYAFTSALPVQLLAATAPDLLPLVRRELARGPLHPSAPAVPPPPAAVTAGPPPVELPTSSAITEAPADTAQQ